MQERYIVNNEFSKHDVLLEWNGDIISGILLEIDGFQAKVLIGKKVIKTWVTKLYTNWNGYNLPPRW